MMLLKETTTVTMMGGWSMRLRTNRLVATKRDKTHGADDVSYVAARRLQPILHTIILVRCSVPTLYQQEHGDYRQN